jgi:hypothetical protein
MKFVYLSALLLSHSALAQLGADVLLQNAGSTTATDAQSGQVIEAGDFKLTDSFLQTLFVEWKSQGQQSFEVNRWFRQILTHDFKGAAHQWTNIQKELPTTLRDTGFFAWTYLTWKLELNQTFIENWRTARKLQGNERVKVALDQFITLGAGHAWTSKAKPFIDPTFKNELTALVNPLGFDLELLAWATRYDATYAKAMLDRLPLGHPLAMTLATTATLGFARKGEIGEAGKLLKRRVEPELEKIYEVKELPKYYITLARLLYQAGALEAADAFYSKIPRGSEQFLAARAERTWVLLRLGRVGELRGELQSLSHNVFKQNFLPEVALVRSISNLKLCRYADVAEDFSQFISGHGKWISEINTGLANPETSKITDSRIQLFEAAIAQKTTEQKTLQALATESIQAALPAVGEQPHWVKAQAQVLTALEEEKRKLNAEKLRFWKNREVVLAEVIRKMKFVKVESMSQIRMMAQENKTESEITTDTVTKIQSARVQGSQSYPFDGVYWPDELFQLYAKAQTRCEGK